jgi:hypothetical protein
MIPSSRKRARVEAKSSALPYVPVFESAPVIQYPTYPFEDTKTQFDQKELYLLAKYFKESFLYLMRQIDELKQLLQANAEDWRQRNNHYVKQQ